MTYCVHGSSLDFEFCDVGLPLNREPFWVTIRVFVDLYPWKKENEVIFNCLDLAICAHIEWWTFVIL